MPDRTDTILAEIVEQARSESGVIVVRDAPAADPVVLVSFGLPEVAVAGLEAAMRDPDHPVTRTFTDPVAAFDVAPTRPGGPTLRAHVPLAIERGGRSAVVGVLALAYERPLDEPSRHAVEAAAGRMAAAIDARR